MLQLNNVAIAGIPKKSKDQKKVVNVRYAGGIVHVFEERIAEIVIPDTIYYSNGDAVTPEFAKTRCRDRPHGSEPW